MMSTAPWPGSPDAAWLLPTQTAVATFGVLLSIAIVLVLGAVARTVIRSLEAPRPVAPVVLEPDPLLVVAARCRAVVGPLHQAPLTEDDVTRFGKEMERVDDVVERVLAERRRARPVRGTDAGLEQE